MAIKARDRRTRTVEREAAIDAKPRGVRTSARALGSDADTAYNALGHACVLDQIYGRSATRGSSCAILRTQLAMFARLA